MRKLWFLFPLMALTALWPFGSSQPKSPMSIQYSKLSRLHTALEEKKGYYCYAAGASMPRQFKWIDLSYLWPNHIYVDEARRRVIDLLDDLLVLAQETELGQYSETGKFKEENASISLAPREVYAKDSPAPYITYVILSHGKISYLVSNNGATPLGTDDFLVETIAEAREQLKQLGRKCEESSFSNL